MLNPALEWQVLGLNESEPKEIKHQVLLPTPSGIVGISSGRSS